MITAFAILSYISLIVLGIFSFFVTYYAWRTRKSVSTGNNPNFLEFQRTYFAAYLLALAADWLQGPYLYRLYTYYGFEEAQIAVLYVCGFASVVGLGTWAPFLVNNFGRKKLCLVCSIVYSTSCLMKTSQNYLVLIIGRILGGLATSLLFTAYEAWYVHEHTITHDFPKEWIPVTSRKLAVWNSVLAIFAGIIANLTAEWMGLGPLAPFILAVPCLLLSAGVVAFKWNENTGQDKLRFSIACRDGAREIADSKTIVLLGAVQALFESVMNIVIFLWTPVLSHSSPSYGVIFSAFMFCILIGSGAQELISRKYDTSFSLIGAVVLACVSTSWCAIFTRPHHVHAQLCYLGLLLYQLAVGVYFSAMGKLREKIIPESHTISIMNWFRVPLNLIACVVLMLLHDEHFRHGNRLLLIICSCLLGACVLCTSRLVAILRSRENTSEEETDDEVFVAGEL